MDIEQFLKQQGIRVWDRGKNVSAGYIGIQCPFCNDHSNHLGIRLKDLKVNCWKCGGHSLINTLKLLLNIGYIDAKAISENLFKGVQDIEPDQDRIPASQLILPQGFSNTFPKIFKDYLEKRNFNSRRIIRKYKLMTCYRHGYYRYRIIIPIFKNHKLVSWTSRDITNCAEKKYIAAKVEESLIKPSELIYNFDSVKFGGDAILVEGPFDVFRVGDGAFCFLGIEINSSRLKQIVLKKIRKLYVFFDNDNPGKFAAKVAANQIAPLVKEVTFLNIKLFREKIDPAKMDSDLITKLKIDLEFNG